MWVRRRKVKVTREVFYGTGRAGDIARRTEDALPDIMDLQARMCPGSCLLAWLGLLLNDT